MLHRVSLGALLFLIVTRPADPIEQDLHQVDRQAPDESMHFAPGEPPVTGKRGKEGTPTRSPVSSPFARRQPPQRFSGLVGGPCGVADSLFITLTGSQGVFDRQNSLSDGTVIDARRAYWLGAGNIPVRFGAGSDICLLGALIQGTFSDTTSWSTMHDTYAMQVYGPRPVIQGVRVHNYGDGIFTRANADGWTIRGSWFSFLRDDCIENDYLFNGLVEDVLFDGCYVFYSARRYSLTSGQDGRANTVTFRNVLARLQPMPTVYSGEAPGHGGFWKLDTGDASPQIALENVIFRVDQPSGLGTQGGYMTLIAPASKLVRCVNVTMVWLGDGPFPEAVPSCYTLTRDRSVWDNAVAAWHAAHPELRDKLLQSRTTGEPDQTLLVGAQSY